MVEAPDRSIRGRGRKAGKAAIIPGAAIGAAYLFFINSPAYLGFDFPFWFIESAGGAVLLLHAYSSVRSGRLDRTEAAVSGIFASLLSAGFFIAVFAIEMIVFFKEGSLLLLVYITAILSNVVGDSWPLTAIFAIILAGAYLKIKGLVFAGIGAALAKRA